MKRITVAAIGEILMDMTPCGTGLYQANPGGAPANVLVQLARLGINTAFIGKVGDDVFGATLKETLEEIGVETKNLIMDPQRPTTLAFVHLSERGDRSFSFYRKNSADLALEFGELDLEFLNHLEWLHFGSLSLVAEPSKQTTLKMLEEGRKRKIKISYDPNLRENLWDSLEEAKKAILQGMTFADLVKISDEELDFLKGPGPVKERALSLMKDFPGIKVLLITRGPAGSELFTEDYHLQQKPGNVSVVDTTGAGDSFLGAFLYGLIHIEKETADLTEQHWKEILHFASQAASFTVTGKGAIPAMGDLEKILSLKVL